MSLYVNQCRTAKGTTSDDFIFSKELKILNEKDVFVMLLML